MSNISGARVRRYTDVYAIVHHGDGHTAYPIRKHPVTTHFPALTFIRGLIKMSHAYRMNYSPFVRC